MSEKLNLNYVGAAELRTALGANISDVEKLAPREPDILCVLKAVRLIERLLSLDLEIEVSKGADGKVYALRRRSIMETHHNLFVEDNLYIDYRMRNADTYSDKYSDFLTAVINFSIPFERTPPKA